MTIYFKTFKPIIDKTQFQNVTSNKVMYALLTLINGENFAIRPFLNHAVSD